MAVVAPLVGFSLQSDERVTFFLKSTTYGLNPWPMVTDEWGNIGSFVAAGNFRPTGRVFESLHQRFQMEIAAATGVPPHVVNGLLRLAIIALLVHLVCALVGRIVNVDSDRDRHTVFGLTSLAVAAVLVAGGRNSSLVAFTLPVLVATAIVLAAPLIIVRPDGFVTRRLTGGERALMLALGAFLATFYDLVYAAPLVAAGLILAVSVARAIPVALVPRLASTQRMLFALGGFLLIFVPTRLWIASACREACYDASEVALNSHAIRLFPDRILTGMPPTGWNYLHQRNPYPDEVGTFDAIRNGFVVALVIVILVHTWRLASSQSGLGTMSRRAGLGLMIFAVMVAAGPAALVSASAWLQAQQFALGRGWRETPLVQLAWAIGLLGAAMVLIDLQNSEQRKKIAHHALLGVLTLCCAATLATNWRLAQFDRQDFTSALMAEVEALALHEDASDAANERRCLVLDHYIERYPGSGFKDGPALERALGAFTAKQYGYSFCQRHDLTSGE